ncbi:MAG: hypothetical protein U1E40_05030 [Amaricoccus sp.]
MATMVDELPLRGPLPDPFDPVAVEARLVDARARRAIALATRARPPAPPPGWRAALRSAARLAARLAGGIPRPDRAVLAAAGFAILAVAFVPVAIDRPAPPAGSPTAPVQAAAAPTPAPARPALSAAEIEAALAAQSAAPAETRPRPRPSGPAAGREPRRSVAVVPRGVVASVDAATIGRAAASLGLRQQVPLPGVTLVLDRHGLRFLLPDGNGPAHARHHSR